MPGMSTRSILPPEPTARNVSGKWGVPAPYVRTAPIPLPLNYPQSGVDTVTGAPAASISRPAAKRMSSRNLGPTSCTPTGNPPAAMSGADGTSHVDTATAGKPVDATAVASPTPEIAAPATTVETPQPQTAALAPPSPPLLPKLAILAPPDASAMRLEPPDSAPTAGPGHGPAGRAAEIAVPRTTFGIDLGGATTLSGLRALWRRTGL